MPAKKNPENWHSSNPFDIETGVRIKCDPGDSWSEVFGNELVKLAEKDDRIVAITAAMGNGTGLDIFEKNFSDRFFDVGICEGHQMTFSAGLASAGLRPVVAVYSTFAQRSIDSVIHDIALQKLPVVICLDRAGVVPGDGPTHHGVFDIALMRPIPNIVIMQPRSAASLARMLRTAMSLPCPSVIRYPRSCAPLCDDADDGETIPIGSAAIIDSAESPEVAIWTLGNEDEFSGKTSELLLKSGINSVRVDARFAKPIDEALLLKQIQEGVKIFLTLEDGVSSGGFGTAVEEFINSQPESDVKVIRMGWPDSFVTHASTKTDLMRLYGITPEAAAERILEVKSKSGRF
jgi:1-deoxy-D-xylulose-5-phosphate synthase